VNKSELIEKRKKEHRLRFGEYKSGPAHIFNEVPTSDKEVLQHGNALAASGNYPVGTSACFNVGISGGCGPECFVYLRGECGEPDEMLPRLSDEEKVEHNKLYSSIKLADIIS